MSNVPGGELYFPISAYAMIGNLRSIALIARNGSLDWCCLPELDSPSVFAKLLDHRRGGCFHVRIASNHAADLHDVDDMDDVNDVGDAGRGGSGDNVHDLGDRHDWHDRDDEDDVDDEGAVDGADWTGPRPGDGEQAYIEGTNVLRTTLTDARGGRLIVTDYMPVSGPLERPTEVEAPAEVHRLLACEGRDLVIAEVVWSPRFDYARDETRMWTEDGVVRARGNSLGAELVLEGLPCGSFDIHRDETGPTLVARLDVLENVPRLLVMRYGDASEAVRAHGTAPEHEPGPAPERAPGTAPERAPVTAPEPGSTAAREAAPSPGEACRVTIRAWRDWVHVCDPVEPCVFEGPLHEEAVRSALALKLLTFGPTGAIAAAPTTSLPEEIGGERNWDYRFSWARDSALISQALFGIGHRAEAVRFLQWQEDVAAKEDEEGYDLQIMYGLRGETDLHETEIPELEGYCGSRPVRIGNGAAQQLQLDVYGELIHAAFELKRIGGEIRPDVWRFLASAADQACRLWQEPDHGFWEVRCEPRHFVSSKVLLWTGLDRAARLAEANDWSGDVDRWRRSGEAIREAVLAEGFDEENQTFTRSFGSPELDASNLLIPMLDFLPAEDPRVQGTIDRTLEQLCTGGLVHRYNGDDGLPGGEGAFVLCTFWLVDALALSGRIDEAHEVFERIFRCRNHVGLLPEEIDTETGAFLGNFPQAFSHVGLINSAMYLAEAEGRGFGQVSVLGGSGGDRPRPDAKP